MWNFWEERALGAFVTRLLIMSSSLDYIATVLHVAPLATAIPAHVNEQPATVFSLAFADSAQPVGGQKLSR